MPVGGDTGARVREHMSSDGSAHGPEGWGGEKAKNVGEMDPPGTFPQPED